ncbi:hypothetical protein [Archangium gephyra]|uniref:hypothetical protein n=1 Tax=Archangium gephyra TaxID=48 RepID=UPI0011C16AFD|nr:hypothetical protein [Archangium gephyra]
MITNQQQTELFQRVRSYLDRGERHVALVDFRLLQALTSEQREHQWRFLREQEKPMRQWSMGIVALINSPTLALVTRAIIHRIKPSVVPHSIVASWPAAVSWAADRLYDNGQREHALRVRQSLGTSSAGLVG